MSESQQRTGVILGGGFSTRFGEGDKALATLGEKPLVRHVADRLAGVCDRLVVNCRDDQRDDFRVALADCGVPVTFATDPEPDRGPMAGIHAGLSAAESTYAVVVACDMPFVDPAFVSYLFDRADDFDAAIPQRDDEWYQTTQAVYRTAAMESACERALERGEGKVLAAVGELGDWVTVTEAEILANAAPDTFDNVNTREELRAAEKRLE